MMSALETLSSRIGAFFTRRGVSRRQLNQACMVLFILMILPLACIALYNYPADDDFQSALKAATAWVQTGSLGQVLRAVYDQCYHAYMTWHGVFASGAYCCFSPMVFNQDLYFLSNWGILAMLCLSFGYLIKTLLYSVLRAEKGSFWIVYTPVMILVLQFLPSIGDGIYWHTGSGYLFASVNMLFSMGLLLRANQPQTRAKAILRGCLLALSGVILGGSFYGPMIAAFVIVLFMSLLSFLRKQPNRLFCLISLLSFAVAMAVNVTAPGIALRQEWLGEPLSPITALLVSVLDSFDLIGKWLSPQLFGMLLLILPALWKPLQNSPIQFRHPFGFFVMLFGLFAATLVPGVYTGAGYGMGRYTNVVYLNFLLLALGAPAYAEGWLIRFLERQKESEASRRALQLTENLGARFTALSLALAIGFLALGGFANTIMNTSSISAAKSLLTGEAATFHAEMKARQEYIRVTDSDVVAVKGLSVQPYVFKPDKLPFQGIYGRVRYMKWYFELFYNAQHPQTPEEGGSP